MTASNRVRLSGIRESVFGEFPASPRMRTARMTGEGLAFAPSFVSSNEIRSDRMNADPIKIGEQNAGPINFELSFMPDLSLGSELFRSAFFNPWVVTPYRDNDGTTASAISDVDATGQDVSVTNTAPQDGAFAVGHLVRFTGFTNGANNAKRRVTAGSATNPVFAASGLVNEAAPPAAARMKVVGFEGASGDIAATATGLATTALDFTTLGLSVGQWVKIGDGDNASFQFATAALNGWARIAAIAANALTLDHRPAGWTTDAGTAKTIRVFFGDTLKNGTTRTSLSLERSFLGQATPTHILQRGMVAGRLSLDYTTEQIITGAFEMQGLAGSQGTLANGASYDPAPTNRVMSANVSVASIMEAGTQVAAPNFVRALNLQLENNLRALTAVGNLGAVDIAEGDCAVTGTLEPYFGDNTMLAKLLAGTPSSIAARAQIDNQALILSLPRVILTGGSPSAGGKNQDVTLPLAFQASLDAATNAQILFERIEHFG